MYIDVAKLDAAIEALRGCEAKTPEAWAALQLYLSKLAGIRAALGAQMEES